MKKKVLISIVGFVLISAIVFFNSKQKDNSELLVENSVALADMLEMNCYCACMGPANPQYACLWCSDCLADPGWVPAGPACGKCDHGY